MAEVRDQIQVSEDLIAKKDALVVDENGVTRQVVAGQKVPLDLRAAYAEETKNKFDEPYSDTGTGNVTDDQYLEGEKEVVPVPGDETLGESQGGITGASAKKAAAKAEKSSKKSK